MTKTTMHPQFYLVGGAVRNFLSFFLEKDKVFFQTLKTLAENDDQNNLKKLEKILKSDLDILAVGAQPQLFKDKRFTAVGLDFPIFLHPDNHLEYALARTERKNGRGYHGFECHSSPEVTLEEDLKRRDFTINAMALIIEVDQDLSPKNLPLQLLNTWDFWQQTHSRFLGLRDPYHGLQDLQAKKLKHISHSFSEDPLRILRLARFAAQYGLGVDDTTIHLIQSTQLHQELDSISAERFYTEWCKAFDLNFDNDYLAFLTILEKVNALYFLYDLGDIFKYDLKKYLQERQKALKDVSIFLKKQTQYLMADQKNLDFEILQNLNTAWPLFDYLLFISQEKYLNVDLDLNLDLSASAQIVKKIRQRLSLPKKMERNLQIYLKASHEIEVLLRAHTDVLDSLDFQKNILCPKILNLFEIFNTFHHHDEFTHLQLFIKTYLMMQDKQTHRLYHFFNASKNLELLYNRAKNIQVKTLLMQKPELKGPAIQQAVSQERLKCMTEIILTL